MNGAQNLGNDAQNGQGKPGEGAQASDPKVQTDPKSQDQPILINPAQRYMLSKNRPDEAVFGNELLSQAGRGRLFDKVQSESQKKDAQISEMAQQLNETLAELKAIKDEQSVRKIIAEMGGNRLGREQPSAQGSENDPGLDLLHRFAAQQDDGAPQSPGQASSTPTIDSAAMMLQMQSFFDEKLQRMQRELAESTQETLREYIKGREQQDKYSQFLSGQSEITARNLSARYPDLDPESVKNIVDLTAQSNLLTSKALQAAQEGDHDAARALFGQKEAFDAERLKLEAEALALQKAIDNKKELREILEADTSAVFAETDGKPRKAIFKQEEKKEADNAALERAIRIGDNVEKINRL